VLFRSGEVRLDVLVGPVEVECHIGDHRDMKVLGEVDQRELTERLGDVGVVVASETLGMDLIVPGVLVDPGGIEPRDADEATFGSDE